MRTGPKREQLYDCGRRPRSFYTLTAFYTGLQNSLTTSIRIKAPSERRQAKKARLVTSSVDRSSQYPWLWSSEPPAIRWASEVCSWLAAVSLFVSVSCAPCVAEDSLTIRFKASKDAAVRQVQEALVEAWGYAATQFLDANLNGVDWQNELQANLDESFRAETPGEVYQVINTMLGKLGDTFTRVIPPSTAGAFENATEGQVVSLGFQVSEDREGALRVGNVTVDGPAERAGMKPGDTLLAINGRKAGELSKLELAALVRTEADVTLEQLSEASALPKREVTVHLKAKPIEVHPVQYAVLPRDDGHGQVGYIRLIIFSKNAPNDVLDALKKLQDQSVDSVVLDLRDNAGGVVLSAYQVSQLFLPEGARFCFVEDGRGRAEDVRMADTHQIIQKPMVVLVNGGTASSAELVAASLHDNHRATLLGEKTFGKGRTQRIIRLKGGGLLLLSNTLYLTPEHQAVDKVGLEPDTACKPEYSETSFWHSGDQSGSEAYLQDPCIKLAVEELGGGV